MRGGLRAEACRWEGRKSFSGLDSGPKGRNSRGGLERRGECGGGLLDLLSALIEDAPRTSTAWDAAINQSHRIRSQSQPFIHQSSPNFKFKSFTYISSALAHPQLHHRSQRPTNPPARFTRCRPNLHSISASNASTDPNLAISKRKRTVRELLQRARAASWARCRAAGSW